MSRRPRGRVLHRLAVAFGFGLLLSVVPLPVMTFATQSVGAVEEVPTTTTMPPDELAAAQAASDEPIGTDRVVAEDADTGTFTAIGFSFDREPESPVLVRIRDASGNLGEWRELENEEADGPDAGTGETSRPSTAPLWVRDATGYEVSLGTEDAATAKVVTVRDELRRTVAEATPLADAAATPPFGINLRGSWGAREARSVSYAATVKLAVVHHSASANAYQPHEVPAVLRSIQAFHMDGNGWSDIGYNFVVDKYGGLWEGRAGGIDRAVIGAHANGFNTTSVGVMVIGDYTQVGPTATSLESVSKVIGWKFALHNVDPVGRVDFTSACANTCKYPAGQVVNLPRVVGHQDVGLTSCPGSIESSLGSITARAQSWFILSRAAMTPVGSLDAVGVGYNAVHVIGWAKDPDVDGPALVRADVGGRTQSVRATGPRPDVGAANPGFGSNTGFDFVLNGVPPGYQELCVTVVNEGQGGADASLGCSMVFVLDGEGKSPTGQITNLGGSLGLIGVNGTTADPDAPAPRGVAIETDGLVRTMVNSGADGTFGTLVVGVPGGRRRVCAIAVNGGAGVNTRVDCKYTDVIGTNPDGHVDSLYLRNGNILHVDGWALDRESIAPLAVVVSVDGRGFGTTADWSRPDLLATYPGYDPRKGFVWEASLSRGSHRVCVTAVNVWQGVNSDLGCRSVVVK
jgi:hypothetical protein